MGQTAEAVNEEYIEQDTAESRNAEKTLYCVGCCNKVRLNLKNGRWESNQGSSHHADIVNDEFVQCSCGQVLGTIYHHGDFIPGEVIPVAQSS